MAAISTIQFLPEIFRTQPNQKFLGATVDQLVSPAAISKVNGYIGRTFAPTYKTGDNYVPEATIPRTNYQLEAGVVVKNKQNNVEFATNYIDLLQNIKNQGGYSYNQDRLFAGESYSFDGHFDYDKFVNFKDYYWLPAGPDAVNVFADTIAYSADYKVDRVTAVNGYNISGFATRSNPELILARGGTYTFEINQPGYKFWIQTEPGTNGTEALQPNISTRNVIGLDRNGIDSGKITFTVPQADAQNFYLNMVRAGTVDAAVDFHFTDIQGKTLSTFLSNFPNGLDGATTLLQNKTLIFVNNDIDPSFWTDVTNNNAVVPATERRNVWKVSLSSDADPVITLLPSTAVLTQQTVFVRSGEQYAAEQFWLNGNYIFNLVPALSANLDYLYYQDSSNPDFVGVIKLVDNINNTINVTKDIIGKKSYTSHNNVTFTNGLKITFDSTAVPASYAGNTYYVDGVGESIVLIDANNLIIPETSFSAEIATTPDYITINRASIDLNPWSRSNRWFHVDVINAAATYNGTNANFGPGLRANRPIIEYEADLQLFDYGRQAHIPVNVINFAESDAFVDIEGKTAATLGTANLTTGTTVIFANDKDVNVINKIYTVNVIDVNNTNYINLQIVDTMLPNQCVLITEGTYAGNTYWFDGSNWHLCQAKTELNQYPQFDIVDESGYSFSDTSMYPGTTFTGTNFFSYQVGTGSADAILGIPLSYQNFNNIGDIVFQSDYDIDTFTYNSTTTLPISSGYLAKNDSLTERTYLNNWTAISEQSKQYQIISVVYNGLSNYVQLDILPDAATTIPYIKVYVNNKLLPIANYNIVQLGVVYAVQITSTLAINDKIDVLIYTSAGVSSLGYYQVPDNLDLNALNESFTSITLGQLRNHYNKLIENTSIGPYGLPPLQDVNLKAQGGTLVQNSAPIVYSMLFMNNPDTSFINSISLARKEYTRFKNKFLELCANQTGLDYTDPVTSVDKILQNINAVKNKSFSWYYSDMVPQGGSFNTITYNIVNAEQNFYEISSIFNNTVPSNRATLVYHNGTQLTHGTDYVFNQTRPSVDLSISLTVGDTLVIREYANTDGNYIPETPSKLGMYPSFAPEIYLDSTYITPTNVILGHDGSTTPAFGDFRDSFLLELEKRIYNNIKMDYANNAFSMYDVVPGRFRNTGYSLNEYTQILNQSFLQWVGGNSVDFSTNQWFDANDSFTWNYAQFPDVLSGQNLQGSWRAVFNYWFDTDQPHLTPWKMLGIGSKPIWWEKRYGPAPYTGGNALLWEDLSKGFVWNDGNSYYDSRFARSALTSVIPVDDTGTLLPPSAFMIQGYTPSVANLAFAAGQQGPVETAWRRSSDYPFAIQTTLALANPAKYFGTQIDLSTFATNSKTGQISDSMNQRIRPTNINVNGETLSDGTTARTAGYINWVGDYIKNVGIDPTVKLGNLLSNLNVQLMYKMAGFTDKTFINILAEQTSPGSTNSSIIIPNENYAIYLNKSVPVDYVTYSGVIVERTVSGYTVTGYDLANPFFNIFPSIANNNSYVLNHNGLTAKVNRDYSTTPMSVPYGTEFSTAQQLCDFLVSYQRHLEYQGFSFTFQDNTLNTQRDWFLSIKEFLVWAQQGWAAGNILVLSPVYDTILLKTTACVVGEITNSSTGSRVLDQNFNVIKSVDSTVARYEDPAAGNKFNFSALGNRTICFAKFELIQTEHVLVIDNTDVFNDIIYVPSQGSRQYRLKLIGSKTGNWTGALDAGGFVFSDPTINTWQSGSDYRQGDLVTFNNHYYTAPSDIAATSKFEISQWTEINQSDIQTGLLPGFAYNAQRFENIYDVDNPPVDFQSQEFSAGLIGFRERSYLTDLGINLQNQVKFYQGYITQKGSMNAVTALTNASFNNAGGNVSVYEEWAFRVGTYGGTNSNPYVEFVIDDVNFNSNPSAFTFLSNTETLQSTLSVPFTFANVYNASSPTISNDIFANRLTETYTSDIPSAGYMNLADIDHTVFDLSAYQTVTSDVGRGEIIWTAKANGTWNVYRVTESRTSITNLKYSLDNFATVTFSDSPGFAVNDVFVVKGFDPRFDGYYQVSSLINPQQVQVTLTNTLKALIKAGSVNGNGVVYKLQSVHLNQLTDLISITPPDGWLPTDKVWVDNATENGWGVYEFNHTWNSSIPRITSNIATSNEAFGTSVKFNTVSNLIIASDTTSNLQIYSGNNYATHITTALGINPPTNTVTTVDTQANVIVAGCAGGILGTGYVDVYVINSATSVTDIQRFANTTPVTGDLFGTSVSLTNSATKLAVGAPGANYVNIYTATSAGSTYTRAQTITGSGNFGQTVKFNADGSRLIIGSTSYSDTNNNVGIVYVYTYNASTSNYVLAQTIKAPNESIVTAFGTSTDLDSLSQNLYISATANTAKSAYNGQVYRYIDVGNMMGSIVGTVITPTATGSIYINGTQVTVTGNLTSVISSINGAHIPGITASNVSGYLKITSVQQTSAPLTISPATGTAYSDLGLTVYTYSQALMQPGNNIEGFGSAISVSADASTLAVSSQGARSDELTSFDKNTTTFDTSSTVYVDTILNSGAVYIYQLLQNISSSVGTYIYGQELVPAGLAYGDQLGASIDVFNNEIIVGAPGNDSQSSNNGAVYVFSNPNSTPNWDLIREQQPTVDINSINRTFIYNKTTNGILAALDYYDPAKGKLLQQYDQDIDYKTVYDPALYNNGTVSDVQYHWAQEQVGKIWWNLDTIRYINYEQDTVDYRIKNWGSVFPGSSVDVYEWVESDTVPSKYTGEGTPFRADDSAYSSYGYVNPLTGTVSVKYYFWVKGNNTIATMANKINSVLEITKAISNPLSTGLPYAAAFRSDSLALFNTDNYLTGKNSVLHINSKTAPDTNVIHSEYELVQEGNPNSILPTQIVDKIIDSIAGIDAAGNIVPDPTLPPSQAYGISIRPRQSIFVNIDIAINNVMNFTNIVLNSYPVVETKNLTRMKSQETIPSMASGNYNITVNTYTELSYVDTSVVLNRRALVLDDSNNDGKWAIYYWNNGWAVQRVQSYNTSLYWSYADWYDATFDPSTTINFTVAAQLDIAKLTLSAGQYIKVLDAGNGNFAIYKVNSDLTLTTVGIQNGTLEITNPNIPGIELRNILQALIYDIFVDDLAYRANQIFFSLVKYVLTEQKNVDWVFKTSFISAKQQLRKLSQSPSYVPDNQSYYSDYVNEVAPYRSVVREFVVDYLGNDNYSGDISDFDLPSYYDSTVGYYHSPSGELSTDANILQGGKYQQWANNYTYSVVSVLVENSGSGYVLPPSVTISGGGGTGATAIANINSNGQVDAIIITNPGRGYTSNPTIVINGTGTGAMGYPVLRNVYDTNDSQNSGHNVVRSIDTTIKFDRTTYAPTGNIINWDTITTTSLGTTFPIGSLIYYQGQIYQTTVNYKLGSYTFDVSNVNVYSASNFNNAADRISAYYEPDNTAIDYGALMTGIDYPGVQVQGPSYNLYTNSFSSNLVYFWANTSSIYSSNTAALDFTTLNFTLQTPSDTGTVLKVTGSAHNNTNFYIAEVKPGTMILGLNQVHDEALGANITFSWLDITKSGQVDSIIQNYYTSSVGVDPTDILIDGGKYYDTYSSHAPEELVPGIIFDNLNMSVFTNANATFGTSEIGYRVVENTTNSHEYYRIASANTAVLSSNLNITDTTIHLADSSVLPAPGTNDAIPGVVIINGEKIIYWAKDDTTNTLSRIRRAVDGTSSQTVHIAGSLVVDASVQQAIPVTGAGTRALLANTVITVTGNVAMNLTVNGNITANIGDFITQGSANTRVLQSVVSSSYVPVVALTGAISTVSNVSISINSVVANAHPIAYAPLGKVNSAGNITITSNTTAYTDTVWENAGVGKATDGNGIAGSHTLNGQFLQASASYIPTIN